MWSLYGDKIKVSEDNDHLGLIVSGLNEEIKNVDKNISSARNALFGFLGNIFSFKCKVSPAVQLHTWAVFVKPVLTFGLSFLPIRSPVKKSLTVFHHKVLRALFWNAWCNPQTKANQVIKYILKMSDNSSATWSAHLRVIFLLQPT